MNVYGFEITAEQLAAGLAAMKGNFKAAQVTDRLMEVGVPEKVIPKGKSERFFSHQEYFANRVADRLIQKERKAGTIVRQGAFWVAIEQPTQKSPKLARSSTPR